MLKRFNERGSSLATFLGWVFLVVVILVLVYFFVPGVRPAINDMVGRTGVVEQEKMDQFSESIDDEKVEETKKEMKEKAGEALKDAGEAIGDAAKEAGDAISGGDSGGE
jgi:hypothetical protein